MVRHDERPRRKRHELPGKEEGERVGGEHDEVHAGEERRKERQHAPRALFMAAVAEAEEARRCAAEIDHQQEKSAQRVEPEVGAEPRQPDRQHELVAAEGRRQQARPAGEHRADAGEERDRIDQRARDTVPRENVGFSLCGRSSWMKRRA